ncbi:4Fe-4S binding protein [Pseudovibrio exalbescens]
MGCRLCVDRCPHLALTASSRTS